MQSRWSFYVWKRGLYLQQKRRNKMKHPRTLNEAFPHTVEYSAAIEKPRMATTDKIIMVLAVCAVVVLVLDLFVWRA
jgi:hypothetical protein